MVNKSKAKGTGWETAIVRYLLAEGLAGAERRALYGTDDRGDIAGLIDWVISAKNCKATTLAKWVDDVQLQQANAGASNSAVWHHRRGRASPADAFVTITGSQFTRLLRAAGYLPPAPDPAGLPRAADLDLVQLDGGQLHSTCIEVTTAADPVRVSVCGPDCPPSGACS